MNFYSIMFIITTAFGNEIHNSTGTNIPVASGDFPHPAVIGGYAASIEAFPFAVRVYIYLRSSLIFCTGEIVHRKLVLTAAHCVESGGNMIVVTGNANQEDYIAGKNLHKYARYRVVQTFVHPKFNRYEYVHDVAIVKLGRAMMHEGYKILPISYEPLKEPVGAIIYGWGGTEKLIRNHQLYAKLNLTIETCQLQSKDYQYICLVGRGICHGDSGGAAVVNGYLRGVASFYELGRSSPCCVEERYYYMSMWEERDFLENTIEKNAANYNRCFLLLAMPYECLREEYFSVALRTGCPVSDPVLF